MSLISSLLIIIAGVGWFAGPPSARADGSDTDLVIFEGQAADPWGVFVGDAGGWAVPVTGEVSESPNGVVVAAVADKEGEGDGIRVSWNGKGEGQFFLGTEEPRDWRGFLDSEAALLVEIKVERPPTKTVTMRMDCRHPCGAKAELTDFLRKVPKQRWIPLSVDLKCFADAGADFSQIDSPFLLLTRGKLSVMTGNIRLVPGAGSEALISCR
jgi:beta-glucosidase